MGETTKQVRVDNWGTFFLQRLQLFFNKTDYCDLTLQFEGNVQLKVHRLVMNACTEYFHILEQTCDTIDDILIMPPDLQPEVVVPIVNFMYTGMLEFQMSMFERLYKTALLMNITVLTKLLDAQKQPVSQIRSVTKRTFQSPHSLENQGRKNKSSNTYLPPTLPGRKLPVWKRKVAPTPAPPSVSHQYNYTEQKRSAPSDPLAVYDNTPKPTRFEWPDEDLTPFNPLESTFDDISYTSRPLSTQEEENRTCGAFDEIKHTASLNKPTSKPYGSSSLDMEEMKDYIKEQKIRSDMTDYDDEEAADNDLEDYELSHSETNIKRKLESEPPTSSKRVRFTVNEKENKETKINITPTGKTTNEMDHTKIISELLKKYPHLVKKNKNIRLKIMAKNTKSSSPEAAKSISFKSSTSKVRLQVTNSKPILQKVTKPNITVELKKEEGPWLCKLCSTPNEPVEFVLYYLYRKHMTDVHNEKFDSRMCKYCGHKSSKHNMLMYHLYTKHGVKPPPAYNFPKCNQCHYVALTEAFLIKHKINHTKFELQCPECKVAFSSQYSLSNHMQITGHTGKLGKTNYDCQYCTKRYQSGANLFSHIKMHHRDEARRDGIVSIDEIEEAEEIEDINQQEQQEVQEEDEFPDIMHEKKEKIKILSNVKVPAADQQLQQQQTVTLEPSSEAEALSNVASGIATSLGLVDIVVLNDNQQYILHSNDHQELVSQQELQNAQPEYILPELAGSHTYSQNQEISTEHGEISTEHNVITHSMLNSTDIASTDELVMVLTDHDYGDGNNELITNENSNIVVLYSHPVDGQENQFITSQGNLLVNSQTGMIEIRNGPPITAAATDHIVVTSSQDTHIESIEMIQQEINSHNNVIKQEPHYEDKQNESTAESHSKEPAESVISDDDKCDENISVSQEPSNETDMLVDTSDDIQVEFNTVSDILPPIQEAGARNFHSPGEKEEANEPPEAVVENATEENKEDGGEEEDEEEEAPETEVMEVEQCEDPTPETVECLSPQLYHGDQNNEANVGNESSTENQDTEDTTVTEEDSRVTCENEDGANFDEDEEEKPEEEEEEAIETENSDVQEGLKPESAECDTQEAEEIQDSEEITETGQMVSSQEQDVGESKISDIDNPNLNTEKKQPVTEDEQEVLEISHQQEEFEMQTDEQTADANTEAKTEEDVAESKEEVLGKADLSDPQDEDVSHPQDYLDQSNEESEIHEQSSCTDSHNENSQSQDENSQSSHISQGSLMQQQPEENTSNDATRSAKISILDDWEDTDSQQSEQSRGVKCANTVHKLIDDWPDDEDDESKKNMN